MNMTIVSCYHVVMVSSYKNDAAPSKNTIAYFHSFLLVITSTMVRNFRNYAELRVSKNAYEKMSTYA
jgi:hypothetical protein